VRVLQVIDGLRVGGAQSVVLGILRLYDRSRFHMVVANVGAHDPALVGQLGREADIALLQGGPLWDPRGLGALLATVRRHRIHVVHTHLAGADVLGGLAARLSGRPSVSTLHNVAEDRRRYGTRRKLVADLATRHLADRVIAVSAAVLESHVRALRVDPARMSLIPNVPVASLVLPPDFDRAAKRTELRVGDGPLLVNVARLDDTKDQETLIRAMPAVVAAHPDATALLVGEGPRAGALAALARELGVEGRIRLVGRRMDAVELMACSDVVCHPTHAFEGLPIALLDAMSLGLPVVASAVDGVDELVEHDRSGLLVPPRDAARFAGALVELLATDDRRERLGAAARERIERDYELGGWMRRIEHEYMRALASRG
jgi:glycosyltransferase involved in cell wall biosynthesis